MPQTPIEQLDPLHRDPTFLFLALHSAHKCGERMLESLARAWLADIGIRVVFDDPLDSTGQKAVSNGR